jgi:tRNA modification GTPase
MLTLNDTIAAIATPLGEGGISVVRVSGPTAIEIAARGFRGHELGKARSHTAHVGNFVDGQGNPVDEVVALVFRSPTSYTGEDTVELSCHGGLLVTRRLLESLLSYGARMAEPGEFTKRAFLNGKMDLLQAEAVADLIHAGSERARNSSLAQLEGRLSSRIRAVRDKLVEVLGLLELELDFVEDHMEFIDKNRVGENIEASIGELKLLADTYQTGKVIREGIKVVLAGAPNVGKSSILNNLLNENRAIVTEIPGTTRDVIEEAITIDGLLFRLVDTAGLRATDDPVEREGVRRTEAQADTSDVLMLVLDGSKPLTNNDVTQVRRLLELKPSSHRQCLIVINKSDLPQATNGELTTKIPELTGQPVINVSALTNDGMDALKRHLVSTAIHGADLAAEGSVTVTSLRHYTSLTKSNDSLKLALATLRSGGSSEFVAVDIRAALDCLGEIIGEVTSEDILNSIFSRFCIGK